MPKNMWEFGLVCMASSFLKFRLDLILFQDPFYKLEAMQTHKYQTKFPCGNHMFFGIKSRSDWGKSSVVYCRSTFNKVKDPLFSNCLLLQIIMDNSEEPTPIKFKCQCGNEFEKLKKLNKHLKKTGHSEVRIRF